MTFDTKNTNLVDVKFILDGKDCHLVVHQPPGGGGGYHVNMNKFYVGCIVSCSKEGWRHYLHDSGLPERYITRIMQLVYERHRQQ